MFDSLTWLHLTWLKPKTQQLAPHRKEEHFSDDISVHIWTDKAGEWGAKEPFYVSLQRAWSRFFSAILLCFALRDPEDSTGSRGGSAAHITNPPHLRQSTEDSLRLAFRREEDGGQAQIWTTSTLWPRQTLLYMCPSQHEPHFFRSLVTLSLCPLHIFGTTWKKSDCPASWHFFVAHFCSVFRNYFQPRTSLYHIIFKAGTHLTQGSWFFIPIWNLHSRLLQPLKTVPSRLNTNQNRSTDFFF